MRQYEIESLVQTVCKALADAEVYKLKNTFVLCLLSHETGGGGVLFSLHHYDKDRQV